MMKMAEGTTLSTLKDLRKAAFICIFQATGISILITMSLYVHIYSSIYNNNGNGINDLGMPGGSGGGLLGGHDGHGQHGGGSGPPGSSNFGPRGGGSGPPAGGNFGPPGSGNGPPGGCSGPSGSGPGEGLSSGPPGSGCSNSGSNSQFAFYAWMILKDWTNIFYQFFAIIDTIVTLFLLRTYRSAFKIVGMKVWNIVKKFLPVERYGRRPTLTNINRPSVNGNQWMTNV
uniref:Uncharacterized protein n=1 Tax=Acrobeloides nanus TaxID=290746 RepID=A0A914CH17_9BILA